MANCCHPVANLTRRFLTRQVSCGSDDLVWLAPFIAREKSRVAKLWAPGQRQKPLGAPRFGIGKAKENHREMVI